ncbi:type II toxin-antitoxin system Phd/YefM family antitoxin [Marinivivus vitaminiproducens]|uniref:type II toxin-antitoxin system Phd/YefM family antitoxin n=1 Tax=Marinivivus vitaminiproducens TaxID=3035935 RepID=UPI00279A2C7A|nr:type II toxin-antitoxin system prevent-host-death family antitoxin [Geminicoccaceae bacterium SCSIO 64248]
MIQVNVHEAKTTLSALLEAVARGEEVIIANRGKPVARLTRIAAPAEKRVFGQFADRAAGFTRQRIDDALKPLTDDELRDWGLD